MHVRRFFGRARALVLATLSVATLVFSATPARAGGCGVETLTYKVTNDGHLETEYGAWTRDRMEVNSFLYRAVGGKAVFTYRHTRYTVSEGSFFKPSCFDQYGHGPYPGVWLMLGKMAVRGTEDSPREEGVMTPEAVMHTTSPVAINYLTVRKLKDGDPDKGITKMSVISGGQLTMSPAVGLESDAGCTAGESLTIDWRGRIRRG